MASKNNEKNRGVVAALREKKQVSRADATAQRKKNVINDGENLRKHGFRRVVNGLKDQ